ncbi:hypothetical protein LINPERPRIM_LOCUS1946 [Linum perenne]
MIVDIVITELLRCMVLISCVSEGKEPFVRSKNFNLYVMDEAVSITLSLIQTRMMEWKISPLNEGLQAVSKNLGEIIESLANRCGFCPLQFTIARKTKTHFKRVKALPKVSNQMEWFSTSVARQLSQFRNLPSLTCQGGQHFGCNI